MIFKNIMWDDVAFLTIFILLGINFHPATFLFAIIPLENIFFSVVLK